MIWAGVFHLQLLWQIESFSLMTAKCTFNWIGELVGWTKLEVLPLAIQTAWLISFCYNPSCFVFSFHKHPSDPNSWKSNSTVSCKKSYWKLFLHIKSLVLVIMRRKHQVISGTVGYSWEYQTQEQWTVTSKNTTWEISRKKEYYGIMITQIVCLVRNDMACQEQHSLW